MTKRRAKRRMANWLPPMITPATPPVESFIPVYTSVIIPAFKNAAQVLRLLGELARQSSMYFEVLVVSDGCADCVRAIEEVISTSPFPLRIFDTGYKDVFAVAYARNLGAIHARGEQLLFLDPDVLIPTNIVHVAQKYHKHGRMIQFARDYVDPKDHNKIIRIEKRPGFKNANARIQGFLTQCSAVDKVSFSIVGGFDMALLGVGGSDSDFGFRHHRVFKLCVHVSEAHCRHIGRSSGIKAHVGEASAWDRTEEHRRHREGFYDNPENWFVNGGVKFLKNNAPVSNPRHGCKKQVVVSFTTISKRIEHILPTINSILTQSVSPDVFVLYVSKDPGVPEFDDGITRLPEFLSKLQKRGELIIEYTEQLDSFKKLGPALLDYPDAVILTIDDDNIYPWKWLENFLAVYEMNPGCVLCGSGRRFARDSNGRIASLEYEQTTSFGPVALHGDNALPSQSQWKQIPQGEIREVDFVIGMTGVLYEPCFVDAGIHNNDLRCAISKQTDDIWISAHVKKTGTKIYCTPPPSSVNKAHHFKRGGISIWHQNGMMKAQAAIKALSRYF